MKKILLLMLVAILSTMTVNADDEVNENMNSYNRELGYFSTPEKRVAPGSTFVLPITFNCEDLLYSLAFGVTLPEDFEVINIEQGPNVIGSFYAPDNGYECVVWAYDYSGNSIFNTTGAIVVANITLKAPGYAAGDYPVTIYQGNYGILGQVDNVQYTEDVTGYIHVAAILIGDVNDDEHLSIGDVTALIDYLLSGDESAINIEAADVNESGSVTIGDVTALIDHLLSSNR